MSNEDFHNPYPLFIADSHGRMQKADIGIVTPEELAHMENTMSPTSPLGRLPSKDEDMPHVVEEKSQNSLSNDQEIFRTFQSLLERTFDEFAEKETRNGGEIGELGDWEWKADPEAIKDMNRHCDKLTHVVASVIGPLLERAMDRYTSYEMRDAFRSMVAHQIQKQIQNSLE